jgi:hypothetical protein
MLNACRGRGPRSAGCDTHFIGLGFEREGTCVDEAHPGRLFVSLLGLGAGSQEERIAFAPHR